MIHLDIRFADDADDAHARGYGEGLGDAPSSGTIERVIGLDHGTVEGNPTVMIALRDGDGKVVIAETTWKLLNALHAACRGRFGPVTDP